MSRWGTRIVAAALAALLTLLACTLVACGGSDSSSSSTTDSSAETAPGSSTEDGGDGNGGKVERQSGQGIGGPESESGNAAPLKVSGGGAAQFRVKGGDNSIQDFGEESDESELEEAALVLHDFYVARAERDWRAACARLSQTVKEQLAQLASQQKEQGKCPQTLAKLTPPLPAEVERETTIVDAGSLRLEDERAFLIYRGMEETVYAILMAEEDGWKVGALAPVPLS